MALLAADPWLAAGLEPTLDSRWSYAIRAGLTAVVVGILWHRYDELARRPERAGDWGLSLVVGILVFAVWIRLDVWPLRAGEATGFDPRTDGTIDIPLAAVRLAGATLVVPIIEELFWRSFLMRWLAHPRFLGVAPGEVGWMPLAISSALFATEHHLWFAGALAGLAYGWLYIRTGSLWAPIVAHAVTNGILGSWVLLTGHWSFW